MVCILVAALVRVKVLNLFLDFSRLV